MGALNFLVRKFAKIACREIISIKTLTIFQNRCILIEKTRARNFRNANAGRNRFQSEIYP